jgi:2-oxoglutarate ferredoxin oxidoreductase subunit alpha
MLRKDPKTGKNTFAVAQAEDELAAIGMAIGAGWSGLRAMTSTSGPGLSLMTEFTGLAYFAEIPIVIWNVQRAGPSTGMPTRTSQGDLTMVNFLGHGDTQQVILLPGTAQECFEFGWRSFDLAERLQMPIFVLSDLDLGMNQWMTKPFEYPNEEMDRGKVLWEKDLEDLEQQWGRYMDIDGDGIAYRTVPGNRHPKSAYFTRGTGHDEFARYSEDPDVWERLMARLKKKYETAREIVPAPLIDVDPATRVGLITFGSVDASIQEARDILSEGGLETNYMRIRAIPFADEVKDFVEKHDKVYVLEINRDGQMHQILTIDLPDLAPRLISLPHFDGLPLTARWIAEAVLEREGK